MIHFNPLRTHRLSVSLRELSISDSEALCMMPEQLEQAAATAMLQFIVTADDSRPMPGQVTDPRMWTVQERTFVIAHYMTHTTPDGNPNFSIGEDGARFSDYFINGTDYIDEVPLGNVQGDDLVMRPLLGYQAELIERVVLSGRFPTNRLSWWAAAMACQMRRTDEAPFEWVNDADYTEWLVVRAQAFRALPESEFADLLGAFLDGTEKLSHFFRLGFTNTSIVAMPALVDGKEVPALPPARFPIRSAISEFTLQILGVPGQHPS